MWDKRPVDIMGHRISCGAPTWSLAEEWAAHTHGKTKVYQSASATG